MFLKSQSVIFIKMPLFSKFCINILFLCTWREKYADESSKLQIGHGGRMMSRKDQTHLVRADQIPTSIFLAIWLAYVI
jgi:hypothetical protein